MQTEQKKTRTKPERIPKDYSNSLYNVGEFFVAKDSAEGVLSLNLSGDTLTDGGYAFCDISWNTNLRWKKQRLLFPDWHNFS